MKKRYILAAVFTILVIFVIFTLYKANVFKSYKTSPNDQASVIEGPPGLEDITFDQESGVAFISSQDRRTMENGQFVNQGGVYAFSIISGDEKFINMTENFKSKNGFYPHGISLFTADDSTKTLFVINHSREGHVIERFLIEDNKAIHLQSITSPAFLNPNDIHAISPTEFYLTNDHNVSPKFVRVVTDFLKIGTGTVVYHDGDKGSIVAEGIPYANGIHTSKDGKKLFVASTNVNELLVYNINDDKTLEEEAVHDTGVGVDNIELDDAGNLYIGCHPQLLKFLGHSKDSTKLSPTVILKITYNEASKSFNQEIIYTDDGSNLSGGSVAAPFTKPNGEEVILLGSVFERKMMILK